jgi:tetratricopeptide (TPR) repeat protein
LVKDFPKVSDYRYDLAETLGRVGGPGRPLSPDLLLESRERLEEALTISTGLVAEYPTMPQYAASQAQIFDKLGFVFERTQETKKAETARRKAIALQSDLIQKHPDVIAYHYSLLVMQSSLARNLLQRGNWNEAKSLLESSTARLELLFSKDPKLGFLRMALDSSYRDLGQVLVHLGETELATAAFKKAEAFGPGRGPRPQGRRTDFPPDRFRRLD